MQALPKSPPVGGKGHDEDVGFVAIGFVDDRISIFIFALENVSEGQSNIYKRTTHTSNNVCKEKISEPYHTERCNKNLIYGVE